MFHPFRQCIIFSFFSSSKLWSVVTLSIADYLVTRYTEAGAKNYQIYQSQILTAGVETIQMNLKSNLRNILTHRTEAISSK